MLDKILGYIGVKFALRLFSGPVKRIDKGKIRCAVCNKWSSTDEWNNEGYGEWSCPECGKLNPDEQIMYYLEDV